MTVLELGVRVADALRPPPHGNSISLAWLETRQASMSAGDLHAEARDRDIIVTMPGTSFRVVYRKPDRGSQLVARHDYFQNEQKGPITRAEFLARAWKLANDKARELGWIV